MIPSGHISQRNHHTTRGFGFLITPKNTKADLNLKSEKMLPIKFMLQVQKSKTVFSKLQAAVFSV